MGIVEWHSLFWLLALILFGIGCWRSPKGMVAGLLRLDYLLVIGTGVTMIVGYGYETTTIIKGVLAIGLIGVMEMILTKKRKGLPTAKLWPAFGVMLALVFYVGMVLI